MHYSSIACLTIDSVINFNKKNNLQVYLKECKYRIKKKQMPKFIKNELKSDSEPDWDSDDKELIVKLKDSDSDSDSDSEVNAEFSSNAKLMIKLKKTSLRKNLNKNIIVIDNYYGDYLLLLKIIDDYYWLLVIIADYLLL